ncbi:sensor histidine kinase [Aneurinibacillus thermoaerophilus]|uniref:sensor histidine kinase n=1 Tax=Aneurinibacillus thermoaerophilus TaxID=143495 RepID=UPI002E1F5BC4|nr:sensor histidine kinase [Aneurinibacillus thermoaerophilus]MED0766156.1 sensor histidine kinase [Aneurinibacillus thermoaerophilus]
MGLEKIRPAARLITAIGKDLIKDIPASVVELVKNSYDADASYVHIIFSTETVTETNKKQLIIKFIDNGHGMDRDTVINAWLVPGTNYKLTKKTSPKKRALQGRKGIGRYAAAILGNYLELDTIRNGERTVVKIDWEEFNRKNFLTDVEIFIDTQKTQLPNGTTLTIKGDESYLKALTPDEIDNIQRELRKLISPFKTNFNTKKSNTGNTLVKNKDSDDDFEIVLKFDNFYEHENKNNEINIEPFPIIDMYHYRLHGNISPEGKASLIYENACFYPVEKIDISIDIPIRSSEIQCGRVEIDLRVFDKDSEGIDQLLAKFRSTYEEGESIGRLFAKNLLKNSSGVGIYRNGFRIRPHGDQGFDWLNLDNRRIQNPSQRIGQDQIVGFVMIQSEELSGLEEKSARDGLKENLHYERLKSVILNSLVELEKRRFLYRQQKRKNTGQKSIYEKLDNLFDFSDFNDDINNLLETSLTKIKESPEKVDEVTEEIKRNFNAQIAAMETQKKNEYEEIKSIIAIYQGQATLGKIISVVLHEGRKSLGWFSNQIPRTIKWIKKLGKDENIKNALLDKIVDRLETTKKETESLTKLFNKLDPLTFTRRSRSKEINLKEILQQVYEIFENELKTNNIKFEANISNQPKIFGVSEDYLMCLTNIVENSIYWLKESNKKNKVIKISTTEENGTFIIDIIDNGPGIQLEYIENETIFIPGFSGKPENSGTGLGLAIAGEAMARNNAKLKAIYEENNGAHFQIELKNLNKES